MQKYTIQMEAAKGNQVVTYVTNDYTDCLELLVGR